MRTTLNIDDDVLIAIKELARRESQSTGTVASKLLRESLGATGARPSGRPNAVIDEEFGFRPFPKRGGVVTNALIDRLREESGD